MDTHRVVLADDHPDIREYVRTLLASVPDLQVTGEVSDGFALLQMMEDARNCPEIIVLDIMMPEISGIEAARSIKAEHPTVKIIVLTGRIEREYLQEAISVGVEGYVLKDDMDIELPKAISEVLAGRKYLSRYFRNTED